MSDGLEQSFAAAARAVGKAPDSEEAWNHLEEFAESLQRPGDIARVYLDTLGSRLDPKVRDMVARRAFHFHEEWLGDDPETITELLSKVLDLDPAARWAFDRLTEVLTVGEQWDRLLALYDRRLETVHETARRKQLLDDAAHVAKDFAAQPDRAIGYMQQLLQLDPSNEQLTASIERLLERRQRWADLVELWRARLSLLAPEQARALRVRMATCCLDDLHDPAAALSELRQLLDESPAYEDGWREAERLLTSEQAPLETRMGAFELLRSSYDAARRPEQAVAAIEHALQIAPEERAPALHREAGERLSILERDAEAMRHYAALLTRQPNDADAREKLRQLAERSGLHDIYAEALVAAAEASSDGVHQVALWDEAALVHRERLQTPEQAIALLQRVLASEDARRDMALHAARDLSELLHDAGRSEERLAVLERLAQLEPTPAVRRLVWGDIARLADELGDTERALQAWQTRLSAEGEDREALDALVDLLEREERWQALVEALSRRAASSDALPQQRRADRVRMAELWEGPLSDPARAIDLWVDVVRELGPTSDAVDALDRLMSQAGRWQELAEVLQQAVGAEHERAVAVLCRLGDIERAELQQPARAFGFYQQALVLDPASEGARQGLHALLEEPACRARAVEELSEAYRRTDDWQHTIELLEPRLSVTDDRFQRVHVLRHVAQLHEQRAEDPAAALGCIARALPYAPYDTVLQDELMRLAKATEHWGEAADALQRAAEEATEHPARLAELRKTEGALREDSLEDLPAAVEAYAAAAASAPERVDVLQALARAAARCGQWNKACEAAVAAVAVRGQVPKALIKTLESAADSQHAWSQLADAMSQAVGESSALGANLARELEGHACVWHRDRLDDTPAAIAAARRALEHEPAHLDTLKILADLQRRNPEQALVRTLQQVHALSERHAEQGKRDLDALDEAAHVALDVLADADAQRDVVMQLYREAAGAWARGEPTSGQRAPETSARWALERLVEGALQEERVEDAIQLLVDATRLPVELEERHELRKRAAELSVDQGQVGRAVELYRAVLAEGGDSRAHLQRLAELYERQQRLPELLAIRRRQLELTTDFDERLQLRLVIAGLVGNLEADDGRVQALLANLNDRPGHPESLEALWRVLGSRGRDKELSELVAGQAERLAEQGDTAHAARLWERIAKLSEETLEDPRTAARALERAAKLDCTPDTLDALARLALAAEQPAKAASWLQQRLQLSEPSERVSVLLRLARAQLLADQHDAAAEALRAAFGEAPRNAEVRRLLLGLYRRRGQWEALAETLTEAASHVQDETTVVMYAHEAAEIYQDRLEQPERAIPVLMRAQPLAPEDRKLRSRLAEGLRADGQLDQAYAMLSELLEGYGMRRSSERAGVHLQLARVAGERGSSDEAIEHLEQASKMDSGNGHILRTLAEMARDNGQLERAERAYRALLLLARRTSEGRGDASLPGAAETLMELSWIAAERGEADQATELQESAMESALKDEAQAEGLQTRLRSKGEHALLERLHRARLTEAQSPRHRSRVLDQLAKLLEGPLQRDDEALELRLKAVEEDPASPVWHDAARMLAERLDQVDRYESLVGELLEREKESARVHSRCELLLRVGDIAQRRDQLDRAGELYRQAEETGVREVDVWRAAASLAMARGDEAEQTRLLSKLASLGEHELESETRADALYRLAEVQLASDETLFDGLDTLRRALDENPRYERAGRILQRAAGSHEPELALLNLYEHVARHADDPQMLLDYLERRGAHPDASPEEAREGVQLALELGRAELAERLMLRAVELGRELVDGLPRTAWALVSLAERRKEVGDLAGAVKWLLEASEVAEPAEVYRLGRELAALADAPDGDLTLAAKLYERLVDQDPSNREAWEPLADIYCALGNEEKLSRLIDETLDSIDSPRERHSLRVKHAKLLMESAGREDEAVSLLREILEEDPRHQDAQAMLVHYLERHGTEEDLLELLHQQMEAALEAGDVEAIRGTALRLAQHLRARPDEAAAVYRRALGWAPGDFDLLEGLLEHLDLEEHPRERAEILERMMREEEGPALADRAMQAAELYERLGDASDRLRVLETAYRAVPQVQELRHQLERAYREQGDDAGLAALLARMAGEQHEPADRAQMLREAAALYRDRLSDPGTAVQLLREAVDAVPEDVTVAAELAHALATAGQIQQAVDQLQSAMERTQDDGVRIDLLRTRAAIRGSMRDFVGMLHDLEAAFELAPESVVQDLEMALQQHQAQAAEAGDWTTRQASLRRLVDLQLWQQRRDEARETLHGWVQGDPSDLEALDRLRILDAEDERWNDLARTCARMVMLQDGEAQIHAALQLADACDRAEQPELAQRGLEHVYDQQPGNADVRSRLRQVYEQTGAKAGLASLLMQDVDATEDPTEQAELLRKAGRLLLEAERGEAAMHALAKSLQLAPGDPETTLTLVDAYLVQEDLDPAEELLDTAIGEITTKRSPQLCSLLQRKGAIARARGDRMQELELLEQAFSADKTRGEVAAQLADRAEELEQWDLAMQTLRNITLMKTGCPISRSEAFFRQSKIALRTGDRKRALLWARRAHQEDPESEQVAEVLRQLEA